MSDNEPFPGSPDDMMDTIAALRARNAQLEAALKTGWGDKIDALRARVAKLEAALRQIYDQVEDVGLERIARAALKDAPR